MWPWSNRKVSSANADLRETFFGDMPPANWADAGDGEPWASFASAVHRLANGDRPGAIEALQAILERHGLESRQYLQAWSALRGLGVSPPTDQAKHVYGVVVDVPMNKGFDTLAAYEDRSARYINFSGAAIIWDAPDARMDGPVQTLLTAGQTLSKLIGVWEESRPPLVPRLARISLLTPSGLQFGQALLEVLAQDAMAAPVMAAATELMQALMRVSSPPRGTA